MKTKVSWAFVLALLQLILNKRSLLGLIASVLFVVGMLLLYNEKAVGKTILAVASFAFAGKLAWNVVHRAYSGYIYSAIDDGIAWYVIVIVFTIAFLVVQYIQLGMAILSGNPPKESKVRKIFSVIFMFCAALNLIIGNMFNGWVYSSRFAAMDAVAFVLAVLISKDAIRNEQPRNHSLVKAIILAVAFSLVINLAPSIASGAGSGNSSSNSYTCQSCGREFQGGTSDSKSIAKTHMCSNCYKNFKSLEEFLD